MLVSVMQGAAKVFLKQRPKGAGVWQGKTRVACRSVVKRALAGLRLRRALDNGNRHEAIVNGYRLYPTPKVIPFMPKSP